MKTIVLAPLHFYRRFVSPAIPSRCRYYPSCSTYAVTAVTRHGVIRGLGLAIYRLARCHPWSLGGVDHVPNVGHHDRSRRRYQPLTTAQPSERV